MPEWLTSVDAWLQALIQDPESLRVVYSALIGVAVFVGLIVLYLVVSDVTNPLRKRIATVKDPRASGRPKERKGAESGALTKDGGDAERGLLSSVARIGNLLMPRDASKHGEEADLLRYANFRSDNALKIFYGIKVLGLLVLPALVFMLQDDIPIIETQEELAIGCLLAAAIGYIVPLTLLRGIVTQRQERLARGLPDAMDLLVVCSEAGLALNAAIQRVANELTVGHAELADELSMFSLQTRAGMDSRAALKDLEDRTGMDDVQALVAMLLQSMRFGTSIADTLRIYAEELRDKRLQRAQEKAARIATLLLFPLIFCIFPSFMLVLLGPALLDLFEAFSGM